VLTSLSIAVAFAVAPLSAQANAAQPSLGTDSRHWADRAWCEAVQNVRLN